MNTPSKQTDESKLRTKENFETKTELVEKQCLECDKCFASFASLKRHVQSVHLKQSQSKCNLCNLVLADSCSLKRHIRLKHSRE